EEVPAAGFADDGGGAGIAGFTHRLDFLYAAAARPGVLFMAMSLGSCSTQLVPPGVYIMVTQRLQRMQPDFSAEWFCRWSTRAGSKISPRPSATASNPSPIACSTLASDSTPPR